MLRKSIAPFGQTATGTPPNEVIKLTDTVATTGTPRSAGVLIPALSTICVHISATATVVIKSNPFNDPTKDVTLTTITVSGNYVVPSSNVIVVHVTANTGTVSCLIVANEPAEY
jgi:hypothetical protein